MVIKIDMKSLTHKLLAAQPTQISKKIRFCFIKKSPPQDFILKDFADCLPAGLQKSSHNSMTAFTPYNAICMYKRCANYIMYLMAQGR